MSRVYIGIDPTAGRKPMAYAVLDRDLTLLAMAEGDIDEVTAYLGGQQAAFVAVSAPRRPNQNLMKRDDLREALKPSPRPGRWEGFRVAEYELRQRNIRIPRTPSNLDDCPGWMQIGFLIYQRLERLGYQDYAQEETPCQMLEVYPHASFAALLGLIPFTKNTLEGRLQRQLILHNQGIEIPDPMRIFEEITRYRILQGVLPLDGLYSPGELDALVAAFTAWAAATSPETVTALGHPDEGQIILPVAEIQSKY